MTRRVLRIITRLNRGGPLRQLEALIPRLPALGWRDVVVTGRVASGEHDGSERLSARGVEVRQLDRLGRGIAPRDDRRAYRALRALIRSLRPDVVHTHLAKAGVLGRLAATREGVPCVHTFHGHHFTARFPRGLLARRAERSLAAKAGALVALSPRQANDIRAVVGARHADRVHVIAPGLELDAFATSVASEPASQDPAPLRVLWMGRFVPVKDVRTLIAACATAHPVCHLTLLGGGTLREATLAWARATYPALVLEAPGDVEPVRAYLAACDVVALSSRSEGTPLSLLEGMAMGKAVVSTAVGGVPDLIQDGVHGLLVAPGDANALRHALERLAVDRDLAAALGRAGAAHVRAQYGPGRLARETAELYAHVVSGGLRGGILRP